MLCIGRWETFSDQTVRSKVRIASLIVRYLADGLDMRHHRLLAIGRNYIKDRDSFHFYSPLIAITVLGPA